MQAYHTEGISVKRVMADCRRCINANVNAVGDLEYGYLVMFQYLICKIYLCLTGLACEFGGWLEQMGIVVSAILCYWIPNPPSCTVTCKTHTLEGPYHALLTGRANAEVYPLGKLYACVFLLQ